VRNGPLLNPFSRIEDFVDDERDVADGENAIAIYVAVLPRGKRRMKRLS